MAEVLRHVLLLFMLAVVCYVIAVVFVDGRLGFIAFFVVGLIAELVFWTLFWRERRRNRHRRAGSHP
jgi:membrane protein implicated in regulation of membrane protease activity